MVYSYEIATIIISILLIIFDLLEKRVRSAQNRLFLGLIIINAITAFAGCYGSIFYFVDFSVSTKYFFSMLYYVSHVIMPMLIFMYTIYPVVNPYLLSVFQRMMIHLPGLVAEIIVLINPFTSFVFSYNEAGEYQREMGIVCMYITAAIYMLGAIIMLIRKWHDYTIQERTSLIIVMFFMLLGVLVQLIFSKIRIESFSLSFAFLIMYFIIQKPGGQKDRETGLPNKYAYTQVFTQGFIKKKYMDILVVNIINYDNSANYIDENGGVVSLAILFAEFLENISDEIDVYRISDGTFLIEATDDIVEDLCTLITDRFKQPWKIGDSENLHRAVVLKLQVPNEIDTFDKLNAVVLSLPSQSFKKEIITIEDFDLNSIERSYKVKEALKKVLALKKYDLVVSPIYDLNKHTIVAGDISTRFFDGECGYIYESDVIGQADKNGQFMSLAEELLVHCLDEVKASDFADRDINFAMIRMSSTACVKMGLIDKYIDIIEESGVDPSKIVMAISERTISEGGRKIEESLKKISEKNIGLCLSEYGKGYTNIENLYSLPFNYVEFSGEIISDSLSNDKAAISLETAVSMINELGIKTIVSGVEGLKEYNLATKINARLGMGSYFVEKVDFKKYFELVDDSKRGVRA